MISHQSLLLSTTVLNNNLCLCVVYISFFTQLYYFNSVLSLYFPYDFCLFKEMDAVLSYGLRYIPIVITTSVCIILFIVYT